MNNFEQARNVLVAVDVQNDFITGSLAVNDGADVVTPLNMIAEAVREVDGDVAFTRDWHPTATPHFDAWPVHCVAETDGAAFHPNLDVRDSDTIISKGMEQTDGYSGWEGVAEDGATLESIIAPRTPNERVRVYLGGIATDFCVKATTIDIANYFASDARVQVYLLRDAIKAVNLQPHDDEVAIQAMQDAKALAITSKEALAMIGRSA